VERESNRPGKVSGRLIGNRQPLVLTADQTLRKEQQGLAQIIAPWTEDGPTRHAHNGLQTPPSVGDPANPGGGEQNLGEIDFVRCWAQRERLDEEKVRQVGDLTLSDSGGPIINSPRRWMASLPGAKLHILFSTPFSRYLGSTMKTGQ
jgi:hypothetical protein